MLGVTALGLAAGYVGGLSGQQYINYIQQFVPSQAQIQKPRGSQALGLFDLIAHTSPSLVALYRVEVTDKANSLYPLPTKQSYMGDAVAVSADGWMVVPSALLVPTVEKKDTKVQYKYIAIYKQKVYPIGQTINDPASGVSFIKLDGVSLRPASFAWEQSMTGLVSSYSVSSDTNVSTVYIGQPHYASAATADNYILHTNTLSKRLNPDMSFSVVGQAIVMDNGDIIGIADRSGIIPADHFRGSLEQVLVNNSVKRISTNISYYDNAWMPYTQVSKPSLDITGATIVDPGPAVISAASFGLKKGDVIIDVNNENIDINRSFSDILSQYKPGSTVDLGVQRDNKMLDIPLILK